QNIEALYPVDYEAEYHVSNFPDGVGAQLQAVFDDGGVVGRLLRLGIHRRVARPEGRYEGPVGEQDIDALGVLLRQRREARG
ncbi:MAG: hypothetical protein ACLGP3_05505, partial [Acidobacteriota bacterium]